MSQRVLRFCTIPMAVIVIVSVIAAAQENPPPQKNQFIAELEKTIAGREQEPAEQVFKNIQTFKGRPAIGVLRIMEMAFVANLGVQCSHCHEVGKWESDAKQTKGVAREMWALRAKVQEDVRRITGKPDVSVTCYTCHKGQAIPAFAPGR